MASSKPLIGISTNEITNFNGRQVSHSTGLRYVEAVKKFTNGIMNKELSNFYILFLTSQLIS